MQNYIQQLLADIAYAAENVALPFAEKQTEIYEWIAEEEEEKPRQPGILKNGRASTKKCCRRMKC